MLSKIKSHLLFFKFCSSTRITFQIFKIFLFVHIKCYCEFFINHKNTPKDLNCVLGVKTNICKIINIFFISFIIPKLVYKSDFTFLYLCWLCKIILKYLELYKCSFSPQKIKMLVCFFIICEKPTITFCVGKLLKFENLKGNPCR